MQEVSDIHPPLDLHCIGLYTVQRSVKALREPQLMGVERCGWLCPSIFTLYWGQRWGLTFSIQYSSFHILAYCHLILNAFSNLPSMIT